MQPMNTCGMQTFPAVSNLSYLVIGEGGGGEKMHRLASPWLLGACLSLHLSALTTLGPLILFLWNLLLVSFTKMRLSILILGKIRQE
jgi:hypothetical protein